MKKVLLALLLAPTAHALAGSAICSSERAGNYNVQFSWDDQGRLTSASLYKTVGAVDRHLYDFDIDRDTQSCSIETKTANVDLKSPSGEAVKLDATINDHGVGRGTLTWKIPSEHFEASDDPLMCSF